MLVKLKHKIMSFPKIWKPEAMVNPDGSMGKLQFSANFLLDADDADVAVIEAAVVQAAREKFKDKWEIMLAGARAKDKVPMHNGDLKADYDGYAGRFYLTARSDTKPLLLRADPYVRDEEGKPLLHNGKPVANETNEQEGLLYAGCFVNANVDIFAYTKPVVGVSATLKGIQFVADGQAFAGGPAARPEDFDDESGGQKEYNLEM